MIYGTQEVGLSPLARGTRPSSGCLLPRRRFIPAGAGNTPPPLNEVSSLAVYPRWRGEHSLAAGQTKPIDGLSPLARGTPATAMYSNDPGRFIPAGAGNTRNIRLGQSLFSVYPRWRGEHTTCISLFMNYFLSALHSTNVIATI